MRWWVFLLPVFSFAASSDFRVERHAVPSGAELLTVFGKLPESKAGEHNTDVPLVSVLRDTLDNPNPDTHRLRYVWVLTSAPPTLLQRAASALPFFYWRPPVNKNADQRPAPVIDLGAASKGLWTSLAGSLTQVMALDPNGALIRSSTRSYRNNAQDHRRLHLLEGLAVLSQLDDEPEFRTLLSEPDLIRIQARLALAGQTFGGLVSDGTMPAAYLKQRRRAMETRGHNWELLRQQAEANGLYFDPLGLGDSRTHALLWISRADVDTSRKFDSKFLGIADPFRDERLKNWSGYTETRFYNAEGQPVDAGTPDARPVELIPLGLYALEYPKVPLLLADFRDARSPKRREMIRHAITDGVNGVAGFSKWGNWPYLAGAIGWNFVRERHGAPDNRGARLKAYSQVRQWLALDPALTPAFRAEVQRRLEMMGVNPLEDSVFNEAKLAQRQYDALLKYADDPRGLASRLGRDRERELAAYEHRWKTRVGYNAARVLSLGFYQHREPAIGQLAEQRRAAVQPITAGGEGAQ